MWLGHGELCVIQDMSMGGCKIFSDHYPFFPSNGATELGVRLGRFALWW